MEQAQLRAFLEKAGSQLAAIRGGLLLAAQNGFSPREIETAARRVSSIEKEAASLGLSAVSGFAERMRCLGESGILNANPALDIVAGAEAALLEYSLRSGDFLDDVEGLIEKSIGGLKAVPAAWIAPDTPSAEGEDDFEIDEESLEIFRDEANGLLANIAANLSRLATAPEDTNALWEIRRNAHTFKGAAGIIGFKKASSLAHRMEDLLDKLVGSRCTANARVIELLANTTDSLQRMTLGVEQDDAAVVAAVIADFDAMLAGLAAAPAKASDASLNSVVNDPKPVENIQAAPVPMVRVSLDRLDELIRLSRLMVRDDADVQQLASDISQKLARLRMIRFGTLETRLGRAVHVTCQEENKKADLTIKGADVEIDTQIIDSLIEPLLHLLKNAVVHGIEAAETRRLLGKPEKGHIEVVVSADAERVLLTVSDDGSGISIERLIQKAVATKILPVDAARNISDDAALELMFHRGLTTADSLSINAGRGVGMSIIRQSVETRGGTLRVASEPHKGATFTISLPVVETAAELVDRGPALQATASALVLVVDDSPSIRRQMAKFVEDAGMRTITAGDAAEALELLLNGLEPDLILSDVEMPNMNGWEFLEYVKTDKNFGHVPVVMVTSLDADKYRQMASRLGAADYIVKPFGPKDLERVLEKFCAVVV